jgi:general secretion pathway protein G
MAVIESYAPSMQSEGAAGRRPSRASTAFTLVEIMIAVAVVGLLASVAGTNYLEFVHKARVARAVAEIKSLSTVIDGMVVDQETPYPNTLAEIENVPTVDPWGRPYRYLRIAGVTFSKKGTNPVRKDRFLVPLNTDYDLYSDGADGLSKPPLSAPESADDVVRASNGRYIGLGDFY